MVSEFRKLVKIPERYKIDGEEINGDEIAERMLRKRAWNIDLAHDDYYKLPEYSEMRNDAPEECEALLDQPERVADGESGDSDQPVFGASAVPSIYFTINFLDFSSTL